MSRFGRMIPIGAMLLAASCADGIGPPDQLERQPLGAVSGPGIGSEELRPLTHHMSMVVPDRSPLFHVAAQSSDDLPELERYELSFWAKRGEARAAEVHYLSGASAVTEEFLHFEVPANALKLWPDGTPFTEGDSVLISVSIDRSEFLVEFGPSGLVFDELTPAVLDFRYSGADGEVPQQQLGIWHQQGSGDLWFPIVSDHDSENQWLRTHVFHFSTYAVSW